jgi:hypothetical protein
MNNLTPQYLKDLFTYTSEIHDHNLRNSDINHQELSQEERGLVIAEQLYGMLSPKMHELLLALILLKETFQPVYHFSI